MPMFEFKNRWTGVVIASQEAETLGKALEILVRKKEVSLREVDLGGVYLEKANLEEANLGCANLRYANLKGVNLRGVYLREANLEGANLEGANLEEANLRGATLRGATLKGSTIGPYTMDSLLTRVTRSDNYEFIAFRTSTKEILIRAGCRTILGTDAYRDHIKENYPGTPKARETLEILEFIDERNKNF